MPNLPSVYELIVICIMFSGFLFIPGIFYLMALQKALARCSPQNRAMPPEQVWLMLIPLFNLVLHFIIIDRIASSLNKEFGQRNILIEPDPGKQIGLVMCILSASTVLPVIGYLTGIGALICWIMYWSKISAFSNRITIPWKG